MNPDILIPAFLNLDNFNPKLLNYCIINFFYNIDLGVVIKKANMIAHLDRLIYNPMNNKLLDQMRIDFKILNIKLVLLAYKKILNTKNISIIIASNLN